MTDYINALPKELLWMIFSYIDRIDLLEYVQNVSATWRKIIREASFLWKMCQYVPQQNDSIENITKFLEKCPMIQTIYFRYVNDGAIGQVIAEHCTELRNLLFNFNEGHFVISYVHWDAILTRNVHLQKLGVFVETNEEAEQIVERIGKVENLKFLELLGSQGVTFSSRPLVEGCKLLEELIIHTSNFSTGELAFFIGNMKNCLLKLTITGEFPSEVIAAVGELLKIQELIIDESESTQNGVYNNLSHLQKLKTLTKFHLVVGKSGTASAFQIYQLVVPELPKIKDFRLHLYGCDNIPDKLKYVHDVNPHFQGLS